MENMEHLYKQFEKDGLEETKHKIDNGLYANKNLKLAQAWVSKQEAANKNERIHRTEQREETAIELAKEANEISIKSNSKSNIANVVAIIAVLISFISLIVTFLKHSK